MAKITILGSGGFGTSLAVMTYKYGHEVTLWSKFEDEIKQIRKYAENKKLLPGIPVDSGIALTSDINCVRDADMIIFAVPSFAVRSTASLVSEIIPKSAVVINVAKGLEAGSMKRLSQILREELQNDIVVLSGPTHAEEVARNMPTTIVAASEKRVSAEYVQNELMNKTFRIYVSDDVIGAELGAALKNVIALSVGICDGMGFGDNTQAALMTRGITEIARLGVTFSGLAGIGDLIVTCTSMHSRNRRAGILIGQGVPVETAVKRVGTVEGYNAAQTALKLSEENQVEMPIVSALCGVLFNGDDPHSAVDLLMDRPKRHEDDSVWIENK